VDIALLAVIRLRVGEADSRLMERLSCNQHGNPRVRLVDTAGRGCRRDHGGA